jgi:hypothetical protein
LMDSRTRKSSGQKSCDFCYTHQSTTDRALGQDKPEWASFICG